MTSILGRVRNSFLGSVVGLLLVLGTPIFLFLNEGKSVRMAKAFDHIAHLVHHVSNHHIDPNNNNNLVHIDGAADVQEGAKDPLLQFATNAIILCRKVEVYTEYQVKDKRTETTTTKREWTSRFDVKGLGSQKFYAQKVSIGEFQVSNQLIQGMSSSDAQLIPINKAPKVKSRLSPAQQDFLHGLKVQNGMLYKGMNSKTPQVGDMRISFYEVSPKNLSVIGTQKGASLIPYKPKISVSHMFEKDFHFIQAGTVSAAEMLQEREANMAWKINLRRIVGIFAIFFGFILLLGPITTVVSWVPFVNGIVGLGVLLTTIILSAVVSGLSMAAGWMVYRPIIFFAVLAVAALLLIGAGYAGRKSQEHRP